MPDMSPRDMQAAFLLNKLRGQPERMATFYDWSTKFEELNGRPPTTLDGWEAGQVLQLQSNNFKIGQQARVVEGEMHHFVTIENLATRPDQAVAENPTGKLEFPVTAKKDAKELAKAWSDFLNGNGDMNTYLADYLRQDSATPVLKK